MKPFSIYIIGYAFQFLLLIGATAWLYKNSLGSKPHFRNDFFGHIKPGKTSAWITIIVGFAMIIFGASTIYFLGFVGTGVGVSLLGFAIAGFMAPSLGDWHDVLWNGEGVFGPSKTFGPTLSRKRAFIPWNDFTKFGQTKTQYWYLETADRERVYWSYLYKGHSAFRDEIQKNRPDIDLPY